MSRARIRRYLSCATLLLGAGISLVRAEPAEVSRGEPIYARCLGCHTPARDSVGPRHCGLFGRRAGTVPSFPYTRPMKSAKLVWSEQTLGRFLAAPMSVVPGTAMTYDGVKDARERQDLIAYLKHLDSTPECQALRLR